MTESKGRVVYIAGPYRAPDVLSRTDNILRAANIARELWRQGFIALCPHMNAAHFDGIADDQVFLEGALELMRRCDLIVLAENWQHSEGTRGEIQEALRLGLPIHEWPDLNVALTRAYFNLD